MHGDDFVCAGEVEQLEWFKKKLTERFEINSTTVGTEQSAGEVREARTLNRIIRITEKGWECEADQISGRWFLGNSKQDLSTATKALLVPEKTKKTMRSKATQSETNETLQKRRAMQSEAKQCKGSQSNAAKQSPAKKANTTNTTTHRATLLKQCEALRRKSK